MGVINGERQHGAQCRRYTSEAKQSITVHGAMPGSGGRRNIPLTACMARMDIGSASATSRPLITQRPKQRAFFSESDLFVVARKKAKKSAADGIVLYFVALLPPTGEGRQGLVTRHALTCSPLPLRSPFGVCLRRRSMGDGRWLEVDAQRTPILTR